ncbi:Glyoxalase [Tumidithrix helvetica PCC 7403]|uniref:VOC family protein n=1 Tax=Tumidithrix helvetica TaxID=3457545 RepID=UPI003C98A030
MYNLNAINLRAFVPAKDFNLSKSFYLDLGFQIFYEDAELAVFNVGNTGIGFYLQKFYVKELAETLMMHLLVEDLDGWWAEVQERKIAEKYQVRVIPPQQQAWKMRDFVIIDPSGVLWRIAENTT